MEIKGLSKADVEKRVKNGEVNIVPSKNKNTIPKIILKNTLTVFNLVNLILAIMIILVGSYKNLLFVLIAIANTLISIVNEVRAKRTVDKMRLVSEQKPTVLRDGKTIQISGSEIVKDDIVIFSLGDQVLVDCEVKEGKVEVNEAFVTGEQDNIVKQNGDKLASGSFIVSGTCKAKAIAVGKDSALNKIQSTAHTVRTANSKLFTLMNNIVKYISIALIPIGALVLWSRFRVADNDTTTAVTSTVASLINMIPEGLILLTSSVLALATIRLSRRQVLVQDLYSVETLARVDAIALDKTGTITTGRMTVHDYTPNEKSFEKALASILSHQATENQTITALKKKFAKSAKNSELDEITEIIDFSSDRKYSGIRTKKATYLLGAVDFITDDKSIVDKVKSASETYRTLALVKKTNNKDTLLGFIRLEDEIRPDAKQIIKYFYQNDIDIRIISGDDLDSVVSIASRVDIKDIKGVNLSSLGKLDYNKLVKEYNVFTRVTPAQKKELIKAMRKQGNTVAMTGDGVNDILAMKEADVSIAIGEGSDAARRSAKLVLLNSGFESIPSVIDEGRQSINNLERSTTLFLAKTVYASILAVIFIFVPIKYPFSSPVEMSLLNFACIGFPGLILALEHNTERIKNRFARNIIEYSVPVGFTISIAMLTLSLLAHFGVFPSSDLATTAIFVTFAIDLILIYWISRPMNKLRASLFISIIVVMIGAFLIPFFHKFFDFVFLTPEGLITTSIAIAAAFAVFEILKALMGKLANRLFKTSGI
ncbi:HAD-IC family P-type ATPase [Candidatus Saccharibacteria bacterium]|nr:HAD-IC family P-type ATPase [Candidatus Saccharibacteria bacterium]